MFGELPKEYTTPLEKSDHPELDNSDLLGELGIKQCQSLIGQYQWLIALDRFG